MMSEPHKMKKSKRLRAKDARGRSVTLLDPVAMYLLRQHDVIDADTLRAIAQEKGVRISGKERGALTISVIALLLVGGLFTHSLIMDGFRDAPYAKTSAMLYFSVVFLVVWHFLKRARFSHIAAAMLRYSRCPHCGYDVTHLPTDPDDGMTVCPECGCAWMLGANARTSPDEEEGSDAEPTRV